MTSHQRPGPPAGIDTTTTTTANPARIYDALLGGKDHYPVDRAAADAILKAAPQARQGARENRAFLQRAVRYLTSEAGIGQFLDIGTGLPTQGNVHEVARQVTPDARVGELAEETGIQLDLDQVGPCVWVRETRFRFRSRHSTAASGST